MAHQELQAIQGMDIYLLDQLMKGRVPAGTPILDAGCGGGRNLDAFIRWGHPVLGIDQQEAHIAQLRNRYAAFDNARFRRGSVEDHAGEDAAYGLVICNAVLHFAPSREVAGRMVRAMARALRPGGVAFWRFATAIGFDQPFAPVAGKESGWFHLPDGSERFLVSEHDLAQWESELGLSRIDPLKTTRVEALRSMTTWVWTR